MNRYLRALASGALVAAATLLPMRSAADSGGPAAGGATAAGAAMGVTYLPAAEVKAGFAKGAVLVDNGRYMVHASRRESAGQAEVHGLDTDIIYVLEGGATIVTGGTVIEGKTTAPDEVRGSGIANGDTRVLAPGDVMIVPNGTPHWFREVKAPLLYYVVKVR